MGKAMVKIGTGDGPAPSASTAEDAAFEYVHNRATFGDWTPRPPIQRWRADQRERFEVEPRRLEAQTRSDAELAGRQAAERS